MAALHAQKKVLKKDAERIQSLIETIEKTIKHLKGEKSMEYQEMYFGFNKESRVNMKINFILSDYFIFLSHLLKRQVVESLC